MYVILVDRPENLRKIKHNLMKKSTLMVVKFSPALFSTKSFLFEIFKNIISLDFSVEFNVVFTKIDP